VGGAGLALALCLATGAAGQTGKATSKKWPPQFPREGATKLFENEHIIVWEQVGRPKEPFMHMHVRDTIVFGIEGGHVDTLGVDGVKNDGKAEGAATARIYPGKSGVASVQYTTAGLGPHAEVAPDPNSVPKTIFIELKGTEPRDCSRWSTACP
jgi:hypothetical protein